MKPTLRIGLTILCLLYVFITNGQTCAGIPYNSPGAPATCTYTYTASGWEDSSGNPIGAPSGNSSGESICILANNADNFALIKGTLYVGPGATYSGSINGFNNGSTLIIEGDISFPNNTSFSSTDIFIDSASTFSYPHDFSPGGSTAIHNKGDMYITGDLGISGSAMIVNFEDSFLEVQGDSGINNTLKNCGLFETYGSITGTGGSGLENYCSVYVHQDINLNGDFTNDGLIILDGSLSVNGSIFYNNDTLVLTNLSLANDQIVGNDVDSILIVKEHAELSSGASITGHLFLDMDDGGGFDVVCGSCVEEVDIVFAVNVPAATTDILENCGGNIEVSPFIERSTLDFDGVDDYLTTSEFINGLDQVSIMAWVKSDTGNSTNMTIAGEDTGCRLWLQNGNIPSFTIKASGVAEKTISCSAINLNEWHHIAGTYSVITGQLQLYVDGVLVNSGGVGIPGALIENTASSNGNFEVGRRSTGTGSEYFKGDIDEVRVFNTVITTDQLQRMVYQEIENNSGNVKGSIINKDIVDITSGNTISWSNLIAYYPMSDIVSYQRTQDFSLSDRITKLRNITSIQDQTAPMPYETIGNTSWTTESTWLNGDVWDIEDTGSNKDWSIIKIGSDVTASHTIKTLGLVIDSGKKLTVQGDNQVENSWYLELNGTLDLEDDSQLIQTVNSDLVTSADGKILRRQEGTPSAYWYNYWSSPVGATGVTGLTDNNAATNNANNTDFSLNMIKDDSGFNCNFTSAYTASGNISTYWLYTFKNGITYWDWAHISETSNIQPGVGYTQKGTGVGGTEQQYIFEGKPNNGTILVNVTDTGGPGNVASVSKTNYLLGNPYPSAIDIHKFIDDNVGVIDGSIQLWQQWGGTSHNLNEYDGGYAQVNKTGSIKAFQFEGFYGANNGSQDGTIHPTRYLPVGQGFITEIVADGNVAFNNSQRVFIKEADADGSDETGSVFSKSSTSKSSKNKGSKESGTINVMQKIRLEFNSTSGPETRRELLLGFSKFTTDAYDYGYEAKCADSNNNDLNLNLDGNNMNIQAYSEITDDKVVPLNFKSSGDNGFEIRISETVKIDEYQEIYLRDNLTGTYFDMTEGTAYSFTSDQGVFNERFEMVFQSEQQTLNTEEILATDNFMYYKHNTNTFYAKKLNAEVKNLALINMRGQRVMELQNVSTTRLENGIQFDNMAAGTYVVCLRTDTNEVLTKKVVVN